jgi:molybdopterin converting factor small subunit
MITVVLPAQLRSLAGIGGDVPLDLLGTVTPGEIVDALEALYPPLKGTLRDPATGKRRSFVRFFACGADISHEGLDAPVPEAVVQGTQPFYIVGAMAGG